MYKILILVVFYLSIGMLNAQIKIPNASPLSKVQQEIGLTQVTIEYSRPMLKGRKIFGAVVPYGEIWRTGANAATTLEFESDLTLNGIPVPKGKYALYTLPGKKEWTVILSINTKLWGAGGYLKLNDFTRFTVQPETTESPIETFTIDLRNFTENSAELVIEWEKTRLRIPIGLDTDSKVFKQIREQLLSSNAQNKAADYYNAAMYYYTKKLNMNQALQWMQKAVTMKPGAFWYQYFYAEMLAHEEQLEKAKKMALEAKEKAQISSTGDYGYIAKINLLLNQINK